MALTTRIELDASRLIAAADAASRSVQNAAKTIEGLKGGLSSASGSVGSSSAAFDAMNSALKTSAGESARAAAGMGNLATAAENAGQKAAASAISLRRMVGVAAGAAGFALMVADPMLRAAGHEKAADYTSGVVKGAASGAMMGSVLGHGGMIVGGVVGGVAGAAGVSMKRGAEQKQAAEEEADALTRVSMASAAALRGIQAMDDTGQAEGALASLREELIRLDQAMQLGMESGPIAERRRGKLGTQIGAAEARVAELQAGDKARQIAEAQSAMQGYGAERGATGERAAFAGQFEAARTAAEKTALVSARLAEFADKAEGLRASLADVAVQADEARFEGLLDALKAVDAESDRLRSMRVAEDKPRREIASPILTDALTRIGGGAGGITAPMNAVERNTSQMARLMTSVDRHLAVIASKPEPAGAVWA